MWKNHRKMDKYTIMKRNLYSISYFPFLLAAGVALAGRGTSFCGFKEHYDHETVIIYIHTYT